MSDFSVLVAIDPLALILPMSVYIMIAEKKHPHEPSVAKIREAVQILSEAERMFVLARARQLAASAKLVEEALI